MLFLIFFIGACVGSFLNVLIYRVPKGESIVLPASHCTKCNTPLKWHHNIPIISWIFLRGKCAFCGLKISPRYPMVELISGVILLMLYMKLGFVWYLPFLFLSFAMLLVLSIIDFDYMAVPDSINFAALIFSLITPSFLSATKYAIFAALGLFVISQISSKIAKKKTMGEADIIVAATMGSLLGFPLFFIALFLAAILALLPALIYKDRGVPFVPFLALGTFIVYIFDATATNMLKAVIHG